VNVRTGPATAAAVTALALLAAVPAASAQTRACAPGDLGDGGTPVTVDSNRVGKVEKALVAGHKYHAERVIERAIGEYPAGSPYRQSSAKEGSIFVTGPAGLALTERPETNDFRGGYEFTAPRAGSLTLTVTWIQELQAQSGASAGECAATAPITLPVFALKPARVSSVKFARSRTVRISGGDFGITDDQFQLVVSTAAAPADPAPVYVVLRVRAGRASAPPLRSAPAKRVRLSRLHTFRRAGLSLDSITLDGPRHAFIPAVAVGLDSFVPLGRTVRFGFSLAIEQGGRTLGGMRSGAICRIAFSRRANRHYRHCTPVGFAKRP
jgi:hypothetical protein